MSRQLFATVNTNQDGMESIPKAEEKMEQLTSFSSAESTPQSQSGIFGEEIKNPQLKPKHPIHVSITSFFNCFFLPF